MGFVNSPPTSANCPTKRRPVFESQVPSPWCARPRWRAARTSAGREPGRGDGARRAPWPPQAREEEVPLRKGQPPGEPEARPHPRGIECDTLGVRQGGGRSAGGRVSWSKPLSGAGVRSDEVRVPRRPWPLDWWLRAPPLLLLSAWGGEPWASARLSAHACPGLWTWRGSPRGRGDAAKLARKAALLLAARERRASRRGNPAEGSSRRKGWTPEAAERQK